MRPGTAERVFAVNVGGTRIVMEEALRGGCRAGRPHLLGGRRRPGQARAAPPTRRRPFTAGRLGVAYINSKHEAEVEALRVAAHGLDAGDRQPDLRARPRRPDRGTSNGLIRRVLLRQIPFYVDGGLNVVDVRDVAEGHLLADRKGKPGERYLLGGRNFTLPRLFADIARISGVPPPPVKVPLGLTMAAVEMAGWVGISPVPVSQERADLRRAVVDLPLHQGEEGARLQAAPPRGDARGRGRAGRWSELGDRVGRAPRSDLVLRAFGRAAADSASG